MATRAKDWVKGQLAEDRFEAVYRELSAPVWRAVYAYSGGRRALADDVVAESFARLLVRLDEVRDPRPWLFTTAFRLASQELRWAARFVPLATIGDPPDEEAEKEGLVDLLTALRQLSGRQRAAVLLHYQGGFDVKEISGILGLAGPTVRVHLHRGRRKLRTLMSGEGGSR